MACEHYYDEPDLSIEDYERRMSARFQIIDQLEKIIDFESTFFDWRTTREGKQYQDLWLDQHADEAAARL